MVGRLGMMLLLASCVGRASGLLAHSATAAAAATAGARPAWVWPAAGRAARSVVGHAAGAQRRTVVAAAAPGGTNEYFAVIEEMKVTELKEQLRRLQQPVSGTKAVLQERLKAALLETPVSLSSVKPVGSSAMENDNADEDDEDQILPLGEGEEAPPSRPRAAAGGGRPRGGEAWAEREEPEYRASGGRGGGWRADEEHWEDAAQDGVELGQEMEAEVMSFSDLGITVRLDGKYRGLIYEDELDYQRQRQGLRLGDMVTVYVQKVRRDGKVDAAFRKYGTFPKLQDSRGVLLRALLDSPTGVVPLGDKSNAEEVVAYLGISKSQFKAAVGMLYKSRVLDAPQDRAIALLPDVDREALEEEIKSGSKAMAAASGGGAFTVKERGGAAAEGGERGLGSWEGREQRGEQSEEDRWTKRKVFVRGLPFSLTEDDVHKMMGKIGPVVRIRGMVRRDDGRPSGVAWVEYEAEADAETAKQVFHGKTFRDRYLEVFNMEEMRSDQHRGRDGGGRRGGGGGGYGGGGRRPDRGGDRGGRGGGWKGGDRGGGRREYGSSSQPARSRGYDNADSGDQQGEAEWSDAGWKGAGRGGGGGGGGGGYLKTEGLDFGAGGLDDLGDDE